VFLGDFSQSHVVIIAIRKFSYLYNMVDDVINIDKEIMSGEPVFTGMRVPVNHLFDYLESSETLDEFLENFPIVKRWHAVKILECNHEVILSLKKWQ
jgi:uncharacterized protein (DUF433 family)